MTAGVYTIVSTASGAVYVGSSVDIERRWKGHLSNIKYNRFLPEALLKAWRTTNGDGLEWIVLEEIAGDDQELIRAEQRWMDFYADRVCNVRRKASRAPLKPDTVLKRLERRRASSTAAEGGQE